MKLTSACVCFCVSQVSVCTNMKGKSWLEQCVRFGSVRLRAYLYTLQMCRGQWFIVLPQPTRSDFVGQLHCVPITPLSPADNYLHGCSPPPRSPGVWTGKTKSKFAKEPENLVRERGGGEERVTASGVGLGLGLGGFQGRGRRRSRQTKGEEGEMMMMSVDRQGELNLLISQSGKKATWGICDWISFKSTSRSIELALLISKEGGRGKSFVSIQWASFIRPFLRGGGGWRKSVMGSLAAWLFVDCLKKGWWRGRSRQHI